MAKRDKDYCVFIGDLIGSKGMSERGQAQERIKKAINKVNHNYHSYLISPFTITQGDEIAAVLKNIAFTYEIVINLEKEIFPLKMRFGISLGKITTPLYKDAAAVDGPAFYKAAEALEKAKKEDSLIVFNTGNLAFDILINTLESLLHLLKNSWTDQQRRIAILYSQLKNQKKVAERIKISQPAVTKVLKTTSFKKVQRAEESVIYLLKNFHKFPS